ncbi:MAG: HEAT repeat domain-containing protein [Polyangia bacterium]
MTTKTIKTTLTCALLGLSMLCAPLAHAGIDGSSSKIETAIASGSVDAIVAELERSENIPQRGAYDAVLKLIDHPSARVREAVGWWVGRRGLRQTVINTAALRLAAQDPIAAANVLDALRGMRDITTLDLVAAYMAHPLDETSGIAGLRCISAIGAPQGLDTIKVSLGSSLAGVRAEALRTARGLRAPVGQKVLTTGASFVPLLSDADEGVRREAALTLGFLGQSGLNSDATTSGLNALVTALGQDSSAKVRRAAAWSIGEMGNIAGLDALKAAEKDKDSTVRSIATAAAGRIH